MWSKHTMLNDYLYIARFSSSSTFYQYRKYSYELIILNLSNKYISQKMTSALRWIIKHYFAYITFYTWVECWNTLLQRYKKYIFIKKCSINYAKYCLTILTTFGLWGRTPRLSWLLFPHYYSCRPRANKNVRSVVMVRARGGKSTCIRLFLLIVRGVGLA